MTEILKGQVGETAEHLITAMRPEQGDLATGNVLRRTCEFLGEGACKQVCQLAGRGAELTDGTAAISKVAMATADRACADLNLMLAIREAGLPVQEVLIVGVTANEVGFGNKLEQYEEEAKLKTNPFGWRELPGFNAFFARTEEVSALGRRLADCADINFEFKDSDGKTVIGFEHGTRTNMFGKDASPFERDGKKVSFTEHALGQAIDHYGADPTTIKIKLAAAIKGHNFQKFFDSREKMEQHLPGWYEDGFVTNVTNPDWQEGDSFFDEKTAIRDTWEANTRGMILRDLNESMQVFGIPEQNFSSEGIIDPSDTEGRHSSHQFRSEYGDTRDLYMTYVARA